MDTGWIPILDVYYCSLFYKLSLLAVGILVVFHFMLRKTALPQGCSGYGSITHPDSTPVYQVSLGLCLQVVVEKLVLSYMLTEKVRCVIIDIYYSCGTMLIASFVGLTLANAKPILLVQCWPNGECYLVITTYFIILKQMLRLTIVYFIHTWDEVFFLL